MKALIPRYSLGAIKDKEYSKNLLPLIQNNFSKKGVYGVCQHFVISAIAVKQKFLALQKSGGQDEQ